MQAKRKFQFIDRSNNFAGIFVQVIDQKSNVHSIAHSFRNKGLSRQANTFDRNNGSKGKYQFESTLQTFGSPLEIQTMYAMIQFLDRTKNSNNARK